MSLTYGPKIEAVFNDECHQTIRLVRSDAPLSVADRLTLHTWSGRPYRSPWGRRLDTLVADLWYIFLKRGVGWFQCAGPYRDESNCAKLTEADMDELARLDARIIVATNKDLARLTRDGLFREDLYYRVNVVRVQLPPLRNRKEDIPLLVDQFIGRFNHLQRKSIEGITAEALSLLMAHDWPGNVRELENIVERAFIMCGEGLIGMEHLPEELTARGASGRGTADLRSARDLLDAQSIQRALERNGYNRLATARELGIHKTTLFRRMKRLGIAPPKRDGRSHGSQTE